MPAAPLLITRGSAFRRTRCWSDSHNYVRQFITYRRSYAAHLRAVGSGLFPFRSAAHTPCRSYGLGFPFQQRSQQHVARLQRYRTFPPCVYDQRPICPDGSTCRCSRAATRITGSNYYRNSNPFRRLHLPYVPIWTLRFAGLRQPLHTDGRLDNMCRRHTGFCQFTITRTWTATLLTYGGYNTPGLAYSSICCRLPVTAHLDLAYTIA